MKPRLPRQENLVNTGPEDPLPFYYHPLTRFFYQKRLEISLALLDPERRYEKILDVGFGSGILFHTLRDLGNEIHGLDIHDFMARQKAQFQRQNLFPSLCRAQAPDFPYKDQSFDLVISLSLIGYIPKPLEALEEFLRILKPGGQLILGFPRVNPLTTWGLPYYRKRGDSFTHKTLLAHLAQRGLPFKVLSFPQTPGLYYSCSILKKTK